MNKLTIKELTRRAQFGATLSIIIDEQCINKSKLAHRIWPRCKNARDAENRLARLLKGKSPIPECIDEVFKSLKIVKWKQ